jgi:hypothetical protein
MVSPPLIILALIILALIILALIILALIILALIILALVILALIILALVILGLVILARVVLVHLVRARLGRPFLVLARIGSADGKNAQEASRAQARAVCLWALGVCRLCQREGALAWIGGRRFS